MSETKVWESVTRLKSRLENVGKAVAGELAATVTPFQKVAIVAQGLSRLANDRPLTTDIARELFDVLAPFFGRAEEDLRNRTLQASRWDLSKPEESPGQVFLRYDTNGVEFDRSGLQALDAADQACEELGSALDRLRRVHITRQVNRLIVVGSVSTGHVTGRRAGVGDWYFETPVVPEEQRPEYEKNLHELRDAYVSLAEQLRTSIFMAFLDVNIRLEAFVVQSIATHPHYERLQHYLHKARQAHLTAIGARADNDKMNTITEAWKAYHKVLIQAEIQARPSVERPDAETLNLIAQVEGKLVEARTRLYPTPNTIETNAAALQDIITILTQAQQLLATTNTNHPRLSILHAALQQLKNDAKEVLTT